MRQAIPRWKRLAIAAMFELYPSDLTSGGEHEPTADDFSKAASMLRAMAPLDIHLLNAALKERPNCPFESWWLLFESSPAANDSRIFADVAKYLP